MSCCGCFLLFLLLFFVLLRFVVVVVVVVASVCFLLFLVVVVVVGAGGGVAAGWYHKLIHVEAFLICPLVGGSALNSLFAIPSCCYCFVLWLLFLVICC